MNFRYFFKWNKKKTKNMFTIHYFTIHLLIKNRIKKVRKLKIEKYEKKRFFEIFRPKYLLKYFL